MSSLDILMEEHRAIERVLSTLLLAVEHARTGKAPPLEVFEEAHRFIRLHADGTHHAKEEDLLFPAMASHGMPYEGGPLACMMSEHELGRHWTAKMVASTEALRRGDTSALPTLVDAAERYAQLLLAHIQKEDLGLYPLARKLLPPEALAGLAEAYARIDAEAPTRLGDAAEAVARMLPAPAKVA